MPKKKAKNIESGEILRVFFVCPYCDNNQDTEFWDFSYKKDVECTQCSKVCIVDVNEGD